MQSQGVTVKTQARESTSVACVGYQSARQILAMAPSQEASLYGVAPERGAM